MLAVRTLNLIKRYMRLFEQGGVEDLGEVPREVLRTDEPNEGEIVRDIDREVAGPRLEKLSEMLREKLGEKYSVVILEDADWSIEIGTEEGERVVMKFQVIDGEGQIVFTRGDTKVTVSLTPLVDRSMVDEREIVDELTTNEEALEEIIKSIRQVLGEAGVEEVPAEGGEEREERVGESRLLRRMRLRSENRLSEDRRKRIERLKKLMEIRKKIREQKTDAEIDKYEVKKVADAEVKYSQVDMPMEAEITKKALERMSLLDITKKVSPGEGGYPDIIGYIQKPEKQ